VIALVSIVDGAVRKGTSMVLRALTQAT